MVAGQDKLVYQPAMARSRSHRMSKKSRFQTRPGIRLLPDRGVWCDITRQSNGV